MMEDRRGRGRDRGRTTVADDGDSSLVRWGDC